MMDEAKTGRFKTRQRISSLPDGIREMSNSFVKLRHSSFGGKLPKDLSAGVGRRHTIHVPYTGSFVQDLTDEFKFCINPGAESYVEPRGEGNLTKQGDNELETRNAQFPVLQDAQLTLEPTAGKKIKRLQRLHSYNDGYESEGAIQTSLQAWSCIKSGTNHASPLRLGAKSTFPAIKNTLHDCRRNSLPVSTENMADLFSVSLSASEILGEGGVGHTKAAKANSLPQVTHSKLINLKINQPEKAGHSLEESENQRKSSSTNTGCHCFRPNQTRSCAESKTKNAYEKGKAQAIRTYVEKADASFNKEEATAVRLFEWLKDQTDNEESG